MAKTEMIRARVEPELKRSAEAIFETVGLTPTQAITLFYKQVSLRHGLPFEVRVPSAVTVRAMAQARSGRGVKDIGSLDELKADIL